LSLIRTNLDNPGQRNKAWRMTYAQKLFLGYFGQNSMKIKNFFVGHWSLICSQEIVRKLKKRFLIFIIF